MQLIAPPQPRAAVVLLAGGHGGLQMFRNGSLRWGENNFLVRSRDLFVQQGLAVALVDAPSDRQSSPFLTGFRATTDHAADLKAVIAWLRAQAAIPVWLVGTSRGTESAAYVASELTGAEGPDGIVLTSSILVDARGLPVTAMALDKIRVPVLVVHHRKDGCRVCPPAELPRLMDGLTAAPRKELVTVDGGRDEGDPCHAMAHHGYNGIEADVVARIAAWLPQQR
jgi:pimeloyl-ACP methyl ester carboxylesterase